MGACDDSTPLRGAGYQLPREAKIESRPAVFLHTAYRTIKTIPIRNTTSKERFAQSRPQNKAITRRGRNRFYPTVEARGEEYQAGLGGGFQEHNRATRSLPIRRYRIE